MALERVYLRRGEEGGLGGTRSRRVAGFVRGVEPREREARDRDATESGERAERGRVRRRAIERPGADPNPNPDPAGAGLFRVCTSASDAEAGRAEAAALSGSRAALSGSGVRSISRSRPNPPSIAASRGSPARVPPSRCRTTPPRRNASSFAHVPVLRISAACAARLAPNAGTSRSIAEGGVPGSNARGNARAAAAARAYADCSSLNFSPVPRAFNPPPPPVTSLRCLSSPPARRSYVSSSRSRATRGSLREHASASKTHCNSASTTPIVAPGERPWRIRSRSSNARARREGTRAQFGWSGGSARAATSAAAGGGGPGAGEVDGAFDRRRRALRRGRRRRPRDARRGLSGTRAPPPRPRAAPRGPGRRRA